MKTELGSSHITHPESNIFLVLGFSKNEAESLYAKSQTRINQSIEIKCQLINEIENWIKENSLKDDIAAKQLMTTSENISDIINHRQEKFTIDSLVSLLIATGKTITFSTQPVISQK